MTTPFEPTVVSTEGVSNGTVNPTVQTQHPSVNTAQVSQPVSTTQAQSQNKQKFPYIEAIKAHYEARISALMSEKDRALNERNKSLNDYATLSNEYEQYKAMNTASLEAAINAGKSVTASKQQLEAQLAVLQGEVVRSKVLLEKPHLAAYQSFLPSSGTEEEIKNAAAKLEEIRQQDLQRNGYLPTPSTGTQALPGVQQPQTGTQAFNPLNVYQGRSNLPLSLQQGMPGSTPGMMNPNADLDPTAHIQQLFADAQASGDPAAFDRALEQAKVLSAASINQQMTR